MTFDGGDVRIEVEVRVQGVPKFKLLDVSTDEVLSGSQAKLSVKLQNVGSGAAKKASSSFGSGSTSIHSVLSNGSVYLGDVIAGETKDVVFTIYVDDDAEFGVYDGKVNVTYEDESAVSKYDQFSIGIPVGGKPELHVIKSETDLVERTLSIEVVNIGSAKAVGITGELVVAGSVYDVDYVTSINKDKHTTLKFSLPVDSVTKGDLKLSYKGPDNKAYAQAVAVTWTLPRASLTWLYVILAFILLVAVWRKKLWMKENYSRLFRPFKKLIKRI